MFMCQSISPLCVQFVYLFISISKVTHDHTFSQRNKAIKMVEEAGGGWFEKKLKKRGGLHKVGD